MFSSWLKPISPNSNQPEEGVHAVLGTPIREPLAHGQEEALFACGCFWGAEKGFWKLPGVITTAVGYAGGKDNNPTYAHVCSGRTGHTEAVKVVWNTQKIDFSDLLKLFWECHNPTQGDRQGNDRGSQYRSAIYTNNEQQLKLAIASRDVYQKDINKIGLGNITTEIKQDQIFHYAEEYHQQYLAKPGSRPYCSAMPTKVPLGYFEGANFKLKEEVWSAFDWEINHCVLRSNNEPINF